MRKVILLALLFLAAPAFGQVTHPPTMSSASLPACNISRDGTWVSLTDASTTLDCNTTGGGNVTATCKCEQQSAGVFAWVGVATGAHTVDTDTDDQDGAEVPLDDVGAFFTTDNVEAALQQVGPTMTNARTPTAHASTHASGQSDALPDLPQYALLGGRAGTGQVLRGGTGSEGLEALQLFADAGNSVSLSLQNGTLLANINAGAGAQLSMDSDFTATGASVTLTATAGPMILRYGTGTADAIWIDTRADDAACAAGNYRLWVNTAATLRWRLCDNGTIASILTDANLALAGDVTSSGLTTTIAANSVALGTDTTGGYAASASEGGPATTALALDADPADCTPGEFVTGIAANGTPVCDVPAGGSSSNSFETISTTSGTAPVADSPTDTLTLTAGSGITVTGDSTTDTVTIAATGGGTGDVVGPASSAENQVALFSGTTGKLLKTGPLKFDAAGGISGNPGFNITITPNGGYALSGTGTGWTFGGAQGVLSGAGFRVRSDHGYQLDSDTNLLGGSAPDAGIRRCGAGFACASNGTTGNGSFQALKYVSVVEAFTIADDGAGTKAAGTLTPTSSYVECSCLDANGCDVTMSETGALQGQSVIIVNIGTNACDFADTGGISELPAGGVSLGTNDSLGLIYASDRWIATSRSDN